MKKLFAMVIALSLVLGLGVNATAYDSSQGLLRLYSQDCPDDAITFAEDNYLPFLVASVESGSFLIGETIVLGTPFTILAQHLDTDVYYFPIISDETIVATFRVYKDSGTNAYVGIMSPYLANELNSLDTSASTPATLFMDEGNVMVNVNGDSYVLLNDPEGSLPGGIELPSAEMSIVTLSDPLDTISSSDLVSPNTISKYLYLDITETQGQEEWCFAYAASIIIRYVTNESPTALDIMKLSYADPTPDDMLNLNDVTSAGRHYGLSPIIKLATISPYAEIDADRPVFLRCRRTTSTGDKKYHGLVMRGYNISSNVYSIWNPWNDYYESMSISTNEYVTGDRTYTWIETIYNWK